MFDVHTQTTLNLDTKFPTHPLLVHVCWRQWLQKLCEITVTDVCELIQLIWLIVDIVDCLLLPGESLDVPVSLKSNETNIIFVPNIITLTLFDCRVHTTYVPTLTALFPCSCHVISFLSCSACAASSLPCGWCVYDSLCTDSSLDCRSNQSSSWKQVSCDYLHYSCYSTPIIDNLILYVDDTTHLQQSWPCYSVNSNWH